MKTLEQIHNEAVLIVGSPFPQREKDRHCKELLVYLRGHYGAELLVKGSEALALYQRIESMIGGKG